MSFETQIKEYVLIDNEIKEYNEKLKILRDKRNELNDKIIKYANTNNLIHANIEINNSKLRFIDTKTYNPLSLKYIEKCLKEIITDEKNIDTIINYIKHNREYKNNTEIKRLYDK